MILFSGDKHVKLHHLNPGHNDIIWIFGHLDPPVSTPTSVKGSWAAQRRNILHEWTSWVIHVIVQRSLSATNLHSDGPSQSRDTWRLFWGLNCDDVLPPSRQHLAHFLVWITCDVIATGTLLKLANCAPGSFPAVILWGGWHIPVEWTSHPCWHHQGKAGIAVTVLGLFSFFQFFFFLIFGWCDGFVSLMNECMKTLFRVVSRQDGVPSSQQFW